MFHDCAFFPATALCCISSCIKDAGLTKDRQTGRACFQVASAASRRAEWNPQFMLLWWLCCSIKLTYVPRYQTNIDQHVSAAEKQERNLPAKASLEAAKLDEAKAYQVLTCCSSPLGRLDSVRDPPRIPRRNLPSHRLPGFLFCRLIQASHVVGAPPLQLNVLISYLACRRRLRTNMRPIAR